MAYGYAGGSDFFRYSDFKIFSFAPLGLFHFLPHLTPSKRTALSSLPCAPEILLAMGFSGHMQAGGMMAQSRRLEGLAP